jgi:hypothetical protein
MLRTTWTTFLGDNELHIESRRFLSLAFLATASILGLMQYTRTNASDSWWVWGLKTAASTGPVLATPPVVVPPAWNPLAWLMEYWKPTKAKTEPVWFRPGVNEALVALALISPLYLRGILKWRASVYSITSFLLISFVVAMLLAIAMKVGPGQTSYVLPALATAVGLSWLGMRSVAGLGWIIVLGAGVYSLHSSSIIMETAGFAFIVSAFLGLVLHSDLNPGELWHGMMLEYSPGMRQALESSRGDVQALGQNVKKLAKTAGQLALPGD